MKNIAVSGQNFGRKLNSNIASEIKRVISLQQKAIQSEDITSAKIREDRIKRAIQLITSNKKKIIESKLLEPI